MNLSPSAFQQCITFPLPMNLKMPILIVNTLRNLKFKCAKRALVRGVLTLPSPEEVCV